MTTGRPSGRDKRELAERNHVGKIARRRVGAFAVRLVHCENICALEDTCLDRLNIVSHSGRDDHESRMTGVRHVELVLTDADGLDEHDASAPGAQHSYEVTRGRGESAKRPAGGNRANEDLRVFEVALHPDPVTQNGPSAERASRVDCDHADAAVFAAKCLDQSIGERALAYPRTSGYADDPGIAAAGVQRSQDVPITRCAVVDRAAHSPKRSNVSVEQSRAEVEHWGAFTHDLEP